MEKKQSDNLRPFKKGKDERRNTTGANKGSKWKTTLLKELMTIDLEANDIKTFNEFEQKFPALFNYSDQAKNFQLFMELKQISLVFHKNGIIAQNAINAIKDRIDGKPKIHLDHTSGGEVMYYQPIWGEVDPILENEKPNQININN